MAKKRADYERIRLHLHLADYKYCIASYPVYKYPVSIVSAL